MRKTKWTKELIRSTREDLGLSQDELADKLGCRQQTISSWEVGFYSPGNAYQKLLTLYFRQAYEGKKSMEKMHGQKNNPTTETTY